MTSGSNSAFGKNSVWVWSKDTVNCSLNKMGLGFSVQTEKALQKFQKPPRGGLQMKSGGLGNTQIK